MRHDLTLENIEKICSSIQKPQYNPSDLKASIAHLGVGAFFRSHLADYTQDAIEYHWQKNNTASNWGIQAIDLRTPEVTDALAKQDNLYSLNKRNNDGLEKKIIGSITNTCFSSEDPRQCLSILTSPQTRILTLTVTEKGYYYNTNTQKLNLHDKDIQQDLSNWKQYANDWPHQTTPKTTLGWITAACLIRKENNLPPLVIISCDNLLQNGKTIQQAVFQFMQANNPATAHWFIEHVCCLSSMVDRITPALSEHGREHYNEEANINDAAPVVCEPFRQWVIEKPKQIELLDVMPKWEKTGAMWVDNVEPYEQIKLQILNALHSTLAYLGLLCCHTSIADCMRDPTLLSYARQCLTQDILPTITPPTGLDLVEYSNNILKRFSNDSLKHLTAQIALDGSQKIPLRWIPTIENNLSVGKTSEHLLLAVSAWLLYLRPDLSHKESSTPWHIGDPLKETFHQIAQSCGDDIERWVSTMLANKHIFPDDISKNVVIKNTLIKKINAMLSCGTKDYMNKHYG